MGVSPFWGGESELIVSRQNQPMLEYTRTRILRASRRDLHSTTPFPLQLLPRVLPALPLLQRFMSVAAGLSLVWRIGRERCINLTHSLAPALRPLLAALCLGLVMNRRAYSR